MTLFFQVQVAKFLIKYNPKFRITPEVITLVNNFVGTRGRKFAEKTVVIHKKYSVYGNKKKKLSH